MIVNPVVYGSRGDSIGVITVTGITTPYYIVYDKSMKNWSEWRYGYGENRVGVSGSCDGICINGGYIMFANASGSAGAGRYAFVQRNGQNIPASSGFDPTGEYTIDVS